MPGPLSDYLRDAVARDWDCARFAAGWIKAATGVHIPQGFAPARTPYKRPSSLIREARRAMRDHGFRRTSAPHLGDVAMLRLVALGTELYPLAVRSVTGWAIKLPGRRSITVVPVTGAAVVSAWRIT